MSSTPAAPSSSHGHAPARPGASSGSSSHNHDCSHHRLHYTTMTQVDPTHQMRQPTANPNGAKTSPARDFLSVVSAVRKTSAAPSVFEEHQPPVLPISERQPECDNANDMRSKADQYNYDLSRAQLKASSNTSALLAGFAMVALVELQYDKDMPKPLLIILGVVTTLLVSVHLLALMMSTCILPYMDASASVQDSPHIRLKLYIDLSWLFSTCIGLLLFLVEIGIIFYVKFDAVGYPLAANITTAMLVPVLFAFVVISCFIHRSRANFSFERMDKKMISIKKLLNSDEVPMIKVV